MPPYQRKQGTKRMVIRARQMRGKGWLGKLWKGVKRVGTSANKLLRKSKLISQIAPLFGPKGTAVGGVAKALGYGRRRRRRRTVRRRRPGRGLKLPGQGLGAPGGARSIKSSRHPSTRRSSLMAGRGLKPRPMMY